MKLYDWIIIAVVKLLVIGVIWTILIKATNRQAEINRALNKEETK